MTRTSKIPCGLINLNHDCSSQLRLGKNNDQCSQVHVTDIDPLPTLKVKAVTKTKSRHIVIKDTDTSR